MDLNEKIKENKKEDFNKLYQGFVKKCLGKNIMPVPQLEMSPMGIRAVMNFGPVTDEEKTEILKQFK